MKLPAGALFFFYFGDGRGRLTPTSWQAKKEEEEFGKFRQSLEIFKGGGGSRIF